MYSNFDLSRLRCSRGGRPESRHLLSQSTSPSEGEGEREGGRGGRGRGREMKRKTKRKTKGEMKRKMKEIRLLFSDPAIRRRYSMLSYTTAFRCRCTGIYMEPAWQRFLKFRGEGRCAVCAAFCFDFHCEIPGGNQWTKEV